MNTQPSLKCLRCLHREVCKLNTPTTCNAFLPDKNPVLLNHALDLAQYRAEMKKTAHQIQGIVNFFHHASAILENQIPKLEDHHYQTIRLSKIVNAITVLQKHLQNEVNAIERKSNFPPQ